MSSTSSLVFARAAQLAWQWVAVEGVVLDLDQRVVRGMNRTGWRIWELLDGIRSSAEIAATVAQEFGVDPERARADVDAFLAQLETRRMVARCG